MATPTFQPGVVVIDNETGLDWHLCGYTAAIGLEAWQNLLGPEVGKEVFSVLSDPNAEPRVIESPECDTYVTPFPEIVDS